jgi:hypothetical protein
VLYPMKTPNRRLERRPDLVNFVTGLTGVDGGARYPKGVVDLSSEEQDTGVGVGLGEAEGTGLVGDGAPRILEGTGSLVLDNVNRAGPCAVYS